MKQEALQVRLADSSYGVDVGAGAVVLGEITCQTEQVFVLLKWQHANKNTALLIQTT